jgi:tRNA (cytidine/uridine-2'-O-)-methyltransferase|mmetsp:Transcript_6744/g.20986  ORF Transcript_6744/g.20986 Transcript_6744/m.20986 type:complete len:252 (-) Transcript_6744:826-1581(-)
MLATSTHKSSSRCAFTKLSSYYFRRRQNCCKSSSSLNNHHHNKRQQQQGRKRDIQIMASAQQVRGIELASSSQRTDLTVVLVCPQIPGNTGTIARTCAATQVPLHLVGPLGFELDDAKLKRAGLDYWQSVCVKVHESYDAFYTYWQEIEASKRGRLVAFSKFGGKSHCARGAYKPGDWLLFGSEVSGLPENAHKHCEATGGIRRIPIDEEHVRSLNLSVSVGVGVYEALRQIDEKGMEVDVEYRPQYGKED